MKLSRLDVHPFNAHSNGYRNTFRLDEHTWASVEREGTCCYRLEVYIRGTWRCCGCGHETL